jgi:cyclophilin family peptidyl-prolyl cis-trans isomerase
LEHRWLLSGVSLSPIAGPDGTSDVPVFDIPSGKDLYVPLMGADAGQTVSYSATVNSGNFTTTVLPSADPTLQLNVSGTTAGGVAFSGAMTFSLFQTIAPQTVAGIESLVNSGLYNGASFYRSVTSTGFQLIQGGIEMTSGKSDTTDLPDEFNVAAAFNSSGLLAMANAGPGTATSEFFITAPNIPLDQDPLELNYGYTIFGQLLTGQTIYNDIENAPASSQYLNTPITITSASIINTSQAGVLQIAEPSTFTGGGSITVTATASDGTSTSQSFNVDAVEPTTSSSTTGLGDGGPMVLAPVNNQTTSENTATGAIALSATENFSGGSPTFTVTGTNTFTGAPANVTPNVTAGTSDDASVTLTPATDWVGDFYLDAHVDDAIPGGSPFPVHDGLPFTLTVTGQADLEVTTTDDLGGSSVTPSTGTAVAGQPISYTVTVSNKGPTNASGVSLVDTLPSMVSGATYTITPSSGAADLDFGGSETFVDNVTTISDTDLSMAAGSKVTFVINATVKSSATGNLASTAVVSPPSGVSLSNLSGNSATDNDSIVAPPVVTPSGTTNTFTVGGAAVAVDSGVTVSYSGSDLTGATVTISSGTLQLGDALNFTGQNSITGNYANGVLTLSGTATPAQYQAALQSITFSTTNTSSPVTRALTIVALDNSASSNSAAESVKVIADPIVTASGTTNTFTLGGAAVAVDSGVTASSNAPDLTGATMTISSGTLQSADTLNFTNQNGITGSYSDGKLTLSGSATPAHYQAALQSVTFSTTSNNTTTRAIAIVAVDNTLASTSTAESVKVAIAAPVVTPSGTVNTLTIGGSSVAVDSGLTVSSFDTDLTGATVTISSGTLQSADTLDFTTQNGITGSYSDGKLTLSGSATVAQYQTALRSVTFDTNSNNSVTRSLTIVALDNSLTSNSAAESVRVITAPVVTPSGTTNTFIIGGAAVAVDSGVTVSSNATDLTGATVTISSGTLQSGDTLNFTNQNGITGSYSDGKLTLSGSATPAQYQTALQSVTFSATSTSTTTRAISVVAFDSTLTSNTAAESVKVEFTPPVVTPSGTTNTFTVGGAAVAVDSGVIVTAVEADLTSATVTISSGTLQSDDALNFTNQNGITGAYSDGVLALSGSATPAQYQTALQSVTFSTTSNSPVTRSLAIVALYNSAASNSAAESVKVIAAPIVTPSGKINTFTLGGAAVAVDSGLSVSSNDTDLTEATVAISSGTLQSGDTLNFTAQNGITGSYSDGKLTLSGSATPAQYQTALQSVTFSTTSTNATARAISILAVDNSLISAPAAETVDIAVAAPVVTPSGTVNTFTAGGSSVAVDSGLVVSSLDTDLTGATVTISSGTLQSADTLNFTNQNGITGSYASGVLTLSGSATPAQYQTALRSVTFETNSNNSVTRSLTVVALDNSLTSNSAAESIKILTAPVVTPSGKTNTFAIGGSAVAVDSGVTVTSNDTDLTGATVTISSGTLQSGDTLNFTTQNGITGSYAGGVLTLSGSATVAQYQTALQSVTFSTTSTSTTARALSIVAFDNSLTSNSAAESVDVSAASGSLSGTAYNDVGRNGTFTSGEAVLANITITLTGTDSNNNTVNQTTLTSSTGTYSFSNLAAGTYSLSATLPTDLNVGVATAGNEGGTVAGEEISAITLAAGATGTGYNFGAYGLAPQFISINLFLASSPPVSETLNQEPTVSSLANQTVNSGSSTPAISFTVGDSLVSASSLTATGTSSNTTLVPAANIVYAGSGADRTVTVTPAANQTGTATITTTVADPYGNQTVATFTLTVNASITVTPSGTTNTFTVGNSAVAVDSGLKVTSVETDLTGATMTISSGTLQSADTLNFTSQNGITGSYAGGVLSLSGSATPAQYQTALQSVTFSTTSTNTTARTISVVAADNSLDSSPASETVDVAVAAPVVTPSGTTNTFTVGGSAVAVDSSVKVSSSDTDLTGATVTISSGTLQSGDSLIFTNQNGITGSFASGVLTLSGSATPAQYQTALQSVMFSTTSSSPVTRSLSVVALDNSLTSNSAAESVKVIAAPVVTPSGTASTYTLGGSAVPVDSGVTVSSNAPDLTGATVTISSGTLQSGDMLNFVNQNGITGNYTAGMLTLSGGATPAQYQAALQSVTFSTSSTNLTTRSLSIVAVDNSLTSNSAAESITIDPAGTPGVVTTSASQAAVDAALADEDDWM